MVNAQLGEPQNGTVNLAGVQALHACRAAGASAIRRKDDRYPDPDNPGMMCRDFKIGGITGSECSNYD